ncbi:MAG: hypothetical protein KJ989_20580 [Gammaproteobacteria bacterium]|nr:hypothetical protein [Gammaproteobacteria bacterium]MBU2256766.1 hypothetical protein [Gammaproteobacteria bacterium]MBU2296593.1 hypothetical protein [Gammaproteobacteria bacterium]
MHSLINARFWYHGSFDEIGSFNSFSHFGSLDAAKERLDKKRIDEDVIDEARGNIYECKISVVVGEVLSVCMDWGSNRAQSLAVALKNCFPEIPEYKKIWEDIVKCQDPNGTYESRKIQANDYGFPTLEKFLLSQGYKVLIYNNEVEDGGSYSLVTIDPNVIERMTSTSY